MIERTKIYGCSDGCICEHFVYLPDMEVYPNSLDINELGVIGGDGFKYNEKLVR